MIEDKLNSFQDLQEQKHDIECYQHILTRDQIKLENAFDELHGYYLKQKDTNKHLTKSVEEAEMYLTQLREWHKQAREKQDELIKSKEALKEE